MVNRESKRVFSANEIDGVVRSLTVVDIDVNRMKERIERLPGLNPGDDAICIIDVECCIIDCSCRPGDGQVVINPATEGVLKEFLFKLPSEAQNPNAPVYYLPDVDLRTAFRLGHKSLKVPGKNIEARVLGVAGEMFDSRVISEQKIALTAPVIALIPSGQISRWRSFIGRLRNLFSPFSN
jgi:hypothetical protein